MQEIQYCLFLVNIPCILTSTLALSQRNSMHASPAVKHTDQRSFTPVHLELEPKPKSKLFQVEWIWT